MQGLRISYTTHDGLPSGEAAVVDKGLDSSNDAAAPLHEVKPLSCFASRATGQVVGGAIGRRWGQCCELQQLWVDPAFRRQGIATTLLSEFEARAAQHGCTTCFLETFSFQAPAFYAASGYTIEYENRVFPHGIVKLVMAKRLPAAAGAAQPFARGDSP